MAKTPKPCDWCRKRRVVNMIVVAMLDGVKRLVYRDWNLCSECTRSCKAALGALQVLSIGRPE